MKNIILGLTVLTAATGLLLQVEAQPVQVPGERLQPSPPRPSPGRSAPDSNSSSSIQAGIKEQMINLDFAGGPVTDLIEELGLALEGRPPVLIPENARDIRIPKFQLRNVTLNDLFSALNLLGRSENWFWQTTSKPVGTDGSHIWVLTKGNENQNMTYYGGLPPIGSRPIPTKTPELVVRPIHVGYLLEKYKIEDITTAIETGWNMAASPAEEVPNKPELKYHKDTELLFVKGYPGQISFVNDLLVQLGNPLTRKDGSTNKPVITTEPPPK